MTWFVLVGGFLLAGVIPAQAARPEKDLGPELTEREQAFHVLNRLAFGPRPGDVDRVMEMGWEKWVREQLDPKGIDNDALNEQLKKKYPSVTLPLDQVLKQYKLPYKKNATAEEQKKRNQLRSKARDELRDAALYRAVNSPRQFEEVIVEFWRNHFNIDNNKDDVAWTASDFENTVIRRHAFGKFEHMLLASSQHPAMLVYLDNAVSQKPLTERELKLMERYENRDFVPRSVAALGRERGLNENYAREIMELHSLGVDRHYKQRDVTELARVLTGWSVGYNEDGEYGFDFKTNYHDDDNKVIFGSTLRGGGMKQGVGVIRELADHKYTAEFIAFKLCRYLVRDEPSEALVDRVATVFKRTNGDLPKVYEAIIFSNDFMYRQNHRVKFKTPFEYTVSALRTTGAQINSAGPTHNMLKQMGQPTYRCVDPTGYYDQAEAWLDPGVLLFRWQFAMSLANNNLKGVRVPDHLQANLSAESLDKRLIQRLVPGDVDPQTLREAQEALAKGGASSAWGVMLGSPEFQQQ
ncbi:DUF1800 domain-containing protein [Algisphaera agarilytica]|uniref:Uncharacterized protein (DUF1800 family) n=1 Tax=Algisphaera agarilytica TaxID=1385975 RepID=A0A7X0LL74_9BACT|nr:DUF1800 domain-containing protein [Algisphaera agarilytica]MBB6429693.1 uncharacterized protein (DUF1800 family) [Algisphaera agarilytica]